MPLLLYILFALAMASLFGKILRRRRIYFENYMRMKHHIVPQQKNLFDLLSTRIDNEFEAYDKSNPHVYKRFCEIADSIIKRGHKHYSADAILHVIRYESTVKKEPFELFKINNNYSSRYARKFISDHPEHNNFFEIRVLRPL